MHAAHAPLDGSTLHLEGLLKMVRFSPRLSTLWLRSEHFGAFDPFITHFVNLAHMSAPADADAAGREDDDDDDSGVGFLSPHLQELDTLPSRSLTEGGKWLLLAWLRKQQGVAPHLYLPGWVKGRAGEDTHNRKTLGKEHDFPTPLGSLSHSVSWHGEDRFCHPQSGF
jgi:hypothetical protein